MCCCVPPMPNRKRVSAPVNHGSMAGHGNDRGHVARLDGRAVSAAHHRGGVPGAAAAKLPCSPPDQRAAGLAICRSASPDDPAEGANPKTHTYRTGPDDRRAGHGGAFRGPRPRPLSQATTPGCAGLRDALSLRADHARKQRSRNPRDFPSALTRAQSRSGHCSCVRPTMGKAPGRYRGEVLSSGVASAPDCLSPARRAKATTTAAATRARPSTAVGVQRFQPVPIRVKRRTCVSENSRPDSFTVTRK